VTLLFTACNTAPATRNESPAVSPTPVVAPPQGSIDPVAAFLLSSAAKDFHTHGPSGSLRFREVRVGHLTTPSGEEQHMLCGQFLAEGKTEWTPFATIKTSGYEQWNGAQAESFCQRPSITWDKAGDLSSLLQTRLESLPR
jgi:hypothetical protein